MLQGRANFFVDDTKSQYPKPDPEAFPILNYLRLPPSFSIRIPEINID
jgi:hypothetical protein